MVIVDKRPTEIYQPISCALHSEYEHVILRQTSVTICWKNSAGALQTENLLPYDVLAHQGEEFLLATTASKQHRKIRLDYIVSMTTINT